MKKYFNELSTYQSSLSKLHSIHFYTFQKKVQINFILFKFFWFFFILGNKYCPTLLFQFLNFSKSLLFCSFINLIFAKEPTESADKAYFRNTTNECVVCNIIQSIETFWG